MTRSSEAIGVGLRALLAAIKASPIVVRVSALDWARVRKSPDVDAFVLAWIASHVRRSLAPRNLSYDSAPSVQVLNPSNNQILRK